VWYYVLYVVVYVYFPHSFVLSFGRSHLWIVALLFWGSWLVPLCYSMQLYPLFAQFFLCCGFLFSFFLVRGVVALATLSSCVFVSWSRQQTYREWVEWENWNFVVIGGRFNKVLITKRNRRQPPKIKYMVYIICAWMPLSWRISSSKRFIILFTWKSVFISHQLVILSSLIYCKLFYNKTWRQAG
jgi:hypothetical protein